MNQHSLSCRMVVCVMIAIFVQAQAPPPARGAESAGKPRHVTPEMEKAVEKARKYLAAAQGGNGSWRNEGS